MRLQRSCGQLRRLLRRRAGRVPLIEVGRLQHRLHADAIHSRGAAHEHEELLDALQVSRALGESEVRDHEMRTRVDEEDHAVRASVIAVEHVIELRHFC